MDPFTPGYGEFQGIPKRTVSEDVVGYAIYLPNAPDDVEAKLEAIKNEGEDLLERYAKGYIWQKAPFKLELSTGKKIGPPCVKGETEFGEAIDDEWFIVFLLRQLSIIFPDAWIRVFDGDGEFLLVEAANALPRWLNPDIATNRVWIHQGMLLIIPLSQEQRPKEGKGGISRSLSLPEAMETMKKYKTNKTVMLHSRMIQEEAFYRLGKYPEAARQHMHNALARVPVKIAMLLREKPALVSRAVEAFYLRDGPGLKLCEGMPDFPPHSSVLVSIKFTKVLYAQLKGQEYIPSPKLGFIPPEEESQNFPTWETGMKLAIGFQILMKDPLYKEIAAEMKEFLAEATEPTKAEIDSWPKTQDDESWLDVDFADFDKNLKGDFSKGAFEGMMGGNLERIAQNFEKFLNDTELGKDLFDDESDEFDSNEDDEDGESDEELDDEGEDKAVSFDENEFERMMREMMGLPPAESTEVSKAGPGKVEEADTNSEDEAKAIKEHMDAVERELRDAGALEIQDEGDEYNLVKNMLESYKSQEGLPGPAGNLLAQLGIVLPKDSEDEDD